MSGLCGIKSCMILLCDTFLETLGGATRQLEQTVGIYPPNTWTQHVLCISDKTARLYANLKM